MSNQSPFVVENLTPKSANGAPTATYELTKSSVSPTRVIGRDARGFPIEETEPTVHWAPFMMLDGSINKVPLRTGPVLDMRAEAAAYETETVTELVSVGCIPATLCPHSTKFQHIVGGPFVPGGKDCGGVADRWQAYLSSGCEHLKAISDARKAGVLERYNTEAKLTADVEAKKYAQMTQSIVDGVGRAIAENVPQAPQTAATRKANLVASKED